MSLNELAGDIHKIAVEHGWWEEPVRTFGDLIALCHSELSEALEESRFDNDDRPGVTESITGDAISRVWFQNGMDKPEGVPIELADTIIRILDMCAWYGIDIDEAIRIKVQYNRMRPHRHGGKRI